MDADAIRRRSDLAGSECPACERSTGRRRCLGEQIHPSSGVQTRWQHPLGGSVRRTGEPLEATTGFEPVIRVLQTPALPLGHVAANYSRRMLERKTGFEPATFSLARRRATTAPLPPHAALRTGAEEETRTPTLVMSTAPSTLRVYQFHHLGRCSRTPELAGVEGLEPPACGFGDRCSSN